MVTLLEDLVPKSHVVVLREFYIYHHSLPDILERHALTHTEINRSLDVISKEMVYVSRRINHRLTPKNVLFEEKKLEKRVWQEFLYEQTSKWGKNTREIAEDVGVSLAEVNKHF